MSGHLIVIEGADGAGKATQAAKLVAYLQSAGRLVETLDFPRYQDHHFGRLLQDCLQNRHGDFMQLDPYIATTLFAADRFEAKEKLTDWLAAGRVVILDRYTTSSQIHQGAKLSSDTEFKKFVAWTAQTEYEVFSLPRPDLVLYLDIPAVERQRLLSTKGSTDVPERDMDHQQATEVRAEYFLKTSAIWQRITCADQSGAVESIAAIHSRVVAAVEAHLTKTSSS